MSGQFSGRSQRFTNQRETPSPATRGTPNSRYSHPHSTNLGNRFRGSPGFGGRGGSFARGNFGSRGNFGGKPFPGGNNSSSTLGNRLREGRRRLCPESPFLSEYHDVAQHKLEWEAGEKRREERKAHQYDWVTATNELREALDLPRVFIPPIPLAYQGRIPTGNFGFLLQPTIFCPDWEANKGPVAPWPSKHERDYEGDGRIATDPIHRRFLPLPREDTEDGANWQHRPLIPAFDLEEFYYPIPDDLDLVYQHFEIGDPVNFPQEKLEGWLGKDLMAALDPVDHY
ncbi:hypothetical protein B0A50_01062 [Salinomyces thailandicus]|uniref:Uncharacterized protein n=1 Tax=Salinomyces thailandicus TaxID=706561 RepID=A0A4U0UE52_9PEZI|nr:hypothetical protein B0A50_01062 [Salinomyces thailandica]